MNCGLLIRLAGLVCVVLGSGWVAPSLAVTFVPPDDNTAPVVSAGGVSRRSFQFIPPADNTSPQRTASGASRIGFIPPPNHPAPRKTSSGASRQTAGEDNRPISFIPPPNAPVPQRTASGASREGGSLEVGDAAVNSWQLADMIAVTPPNAYGLTVSARPTVMAYLPEHPAHTAVFSLKDKTQTVIYRQVLPLDGSGGILTISLPDEAPALVPGEYYQWFVTLQTESYITPGSPYVNAWIKRVEPTDQVARAMMSQESLARAEVLAQSGIWYDAAAQLADLETQPHLNANWAEFLTSAGLEALVERSFL